MSNSKGYIVLRFQSFMEKYLIVILAFLIFGMGIAIMENRIPIFYMLVGGAIILILYDAKQKRKDRKSKK